MRFSTILFPLAVLASLALASPVEVEERATKVKVTAVESAAKPEGEAVAAKPLPGAAVHAEGTGATVAKPGKSKRSDYNELDARLTEYAVLYVFTGYGCSGSFAGYSLPVDRCRCYGTIGYNSAFIAASDGLYYGVFASLNCYGTLLSYVQTCYNISPYANGFFLNYDGGISC